MKKSFVILNLITIGLLYVGCAQRPVVNMTTTFDLVQTRQLNEKEGNNTILGNSFLRQNGGGVVTCAGSTVYLIPKTPYSSEIMSSIYGNTENGYDPVYSIGVSIPNIPAEYSILMKKSICDSQGNFIFNNIGDGEYFINTKVTWVVGQAIQGGDLIQKIKVLHGETKKVILTN